jgi:hypothetical protein
VGRVVRLDGSIDDRKANTILVGDSLKGRSRYSTPNASS